MCTTILMMKIFLRKTFRGTSTRNFLVVHIYKRGEYKKVSREAKSFLECYSKHTNNVYEDFLQKVRFSWGKIFSEKSHWTKWTHEFPGNWETSEKEQIWQGSKTASEEFRCSNVNNHFTFEHSGRSIQHIFLEQQISGIYFKQIMFWSKLWTQRVFSVEKGMPRCFSWSVTVRGRRREPVAMRGSGRSLRLIDFR